MASVQASSGLNTISDVIEKQRHSFVVISWNVLHMVHEINHAYDTSPVITRYSIHEKLSNEKLRLNDIIKTLSEILSKYSSIECFICLQEVPGDLIPMLREMLDSQTLVSEPLIHIHTYSRKPHVRKRGEDILYMDSTESLVTIHYDPNIISSKKSAGLENTGKYTDQTLWTPCLTDSGKGALTVTTSYGLSIVNVHVPYENKAAMSMLNNIPWPENNNLFVMVGDMNHDSKAIMQMIDEITTDKPTLDMVLPVTTDKHTRVGVRQNGVRDRKWIDHYVVSTSLRKLAISPAIVFDDIGDISDHFPILLQFKDT